MRFLPASKRLRATSLAVLVTGSVSASLLLAGPTAAAATETPSELVASVYAAALSAGSFHYVDQQTLGINGAFVHQIESGDVGHGEGVQFVRALRGLRGDRDRFRRLPEGERRR